MAAYDEVNSNDRVSFTLFLAVALHALVIFGITFTLNKGSKIAPTLNITIATHKSAIEPEKSDFLAQHNQQASGRADTIKELTTKEKAIIDDLVVRETNPDPQQKATKLTRTEQQVVDTTKDSARTLVLNKQESDETSEQENEGQDFETPLQSREYASLKAKLDKLKQDLANKPRIRRLTSVSTKASHDAAYLNDWAQKIEFVGNNNFPRAALEKRIFGKLRLSVLLKPNGVVDKVEILKSSGHTILDQAAVKIVRMASPFNPIPKEVRKDNDKLEIIRTWRFEITGLSTSN